MRWKIVNREKQKQHIFRNETNERKTKMMKNVKLLVWWTWTHFTVSIFLCHMQAIDLSMGINKPWKKINRPNGSPSFVNSLSNFDEFICALNGPIWFWIPFHSLVADSNFYSFVKQRSLCEIICLISCFYVCLLVNSNVCLQFWSTTQLFSMLLNNGKLSNSSDFNESISWVCFSAYSKRCPDKQ